MPWYPPHGRRRRERDAARGREWGEGPAGARINARIRPEGPRAAVAMRDARAGLDARSAAEIAQRAQRGMEQWRAH